MNHPADRPLTAIHRILDANLDRAREGLRIVEEWCRFGLNDASLTAECKDLRQHLAQWHTADLRAARDTPSDPGTDLTHTAEMERPSLDALLRANLCRVQEALRVLEEYGKLDRPEMAAACKQLRYRVYALDSQLMGRSHDGRMHKLRRSPLYLVTSPHEHLLPIVEAALQGGLSLVQYRDKTAEDPTRLQLAEKLCHLCRRYDALFLVNDRVDIALAVDADGVHLGQQDIPIALARQILGPSRIIGRSTTNPDEMQRALSEGADYIGVGPVYETPTKAGKAAAGLDYVRYAAAHSPIPWFAIGGIDAENLGDVIAAGATQVAVVRAIMQAQQPTQATQALLTKLGAGA
ncbi:thiamine phosphate synthase [Thermoleptolyngbya oregonensis NK1-22]|uniref:Thiamine-phosphate synthase n=1 Tax=Thermoleptolyngbya oregonensis NK1-22 TaxID=2547457 RepID=A0AA97BDK1_9CYAN|nr:thiamine phosphate synthase [Thermoleptolyngbya oregonensis]WOB44469.1 thiamine phosphate synthase [Thermoleptolyngbya oregonensis NK1-22]